MKYLIALTSICAVMAQSAVAQPKISFDQESRELGYILWRNPATVTYSFTNTGTTPLVISNVTTSCGCTKAHWSQDPIPAGGKGEVTATFDAEALGKFYKEVGIYCNASPTPIYVDFTGEVTADPGNYSFTHKYAFGPIRLDKDELDFEDVSRGNDPVIELKVANTSNKTYSPVLMHLPPYLEAKASPEVLSRGKTGTITVTLHTSKLPKLGVTRASVYLSRYPGDKVGSENELPVSAVLLPDFSQLTEQERNNAPAFSISSEGLSFEALHPGKSKTQKVKITNAGKSNLKIEDLQVSDIALAVNLKKRVLRPGETTTLKVTVLTENLPRVKREPRVLLITNDPKRPKVTLTIKATLEK